MMIRIVMMAVLAAAAGFPHASLLACGDKYFVPSRGSAFQGPLVDRSGAKILIFAAPGSPLHATLTELALEEKLRRAGYQPTYATTTSAFNSELRRGAWDVIVVDLAEGTALLGRIAPGLAPAVLPVAMQGTAKKDLADAKKQFAQVLQSRGKDWAFIEAVDRTVMTRAKAARKASNRSGN